MLCIIIHSITWLRDYNSYLKTILIFETLKDKAEESAQRIQIFVLE